MICSTILIVAVSCVSGLRTHNLYWNTTNPMFRVDNTDHIMDVNQGNLPWEYDQVNIICPFNSQEKHVIYSVSKEEFDSCHVSNPRPKIVAICDKPQSFKYFTITFRSLSPIPGGLEFKPGQDYYFISTSGSKNLDKRVGGFCSSHNMKTVFKVADNRQYKISTKLLNNNKLMSNSPLYKAFIAPTPKPTTTTPPSTTSLPIYFYKSRTPSLRNRDSLYYYSPQEMEQLRREAAQKKRERDYRENMQKQSWIAEKLTSSSSLVTSSLILLVTIVLGQSVFSL